MISLVSSTHGLYTGWENFDKLNIFKRFVNVLVGNVTDINMVYESILWRIIKNPKHICLHSMCTSNNLNIIAKNIVKDRRLGFDNNLLLINTTDINSDPTTTIGKALTKWFDSIDEFSAVHTIPVLMTIPAKSRQQKKYNIHEFVPNLESDSGSLLVIDRASNLNSDLEDNVVDAFVCKNRDGSCGYSIGFVMEKETGRIEHEIGATTNKKPKIW